MTQSLLLQRQTARRVQAAQGDASGCSQNDVSRKAAIWLHAAVRAKLVRTFCDWTACTCEHLLVRQQAAVRSKLARSSSFTPARFKCADADGLMTPNFNEISPTSSFASAASTASPGFLCPPTSLSFLPTPLSVSPPIWDLFFSRNLLACSLRNPFWIALSRETYGMSPQDNQHGHAGHQQEEERGPGVRNENSNKSPTKLEEPGGRAPRRVYSRLRFKG